MFRIDRITKVDLTISIGIISDHEIFSKGNNIRTVPSTFTNWDSEWTVTIDESEIWAVFSSPFVFTDFNTIVDFTSIDGSIVVEITIFDHNLIVFSFNIIFWVDGTINIGIIESLNFKSDIFDIGTRPSTSTFSNIEWTSTESITIIWTVISSPSVFTSDDTFVDFTSIKSSVSVHITTHVDFL